METTGRLTADAKIATIRDGRQVVNFTVAINDSYKPKGQTEAVKKVTYINCSYWNNATVAGYLKKGCIVELFGSIAVNVWINMDGEPKGAISMHVQQMKFFTTSRHEVKQEPKEKETSVEDPKDDLPF